MRKPLVILGAIGNCLDVADAVLMSERRADPPFELRGFLDDDPSWHGTSVYGLPVLGPLAAARDMPEVLFVNGIGGPRSFGAKAGLIARLGLGPDRFATVVHPSAVLSASARLGRGTVILGNTTVCANVAIGNHVMVLPNCVFGHDTRVGDHVTIAAGVTLSGSVTIGASCYIGSGAAVRDGISVGDRTLIGMGAVVVRDAPPSAVLAGNPACVLRHS